MAYSLQIVKDGTTYDVSNYITDISDISYYVRNQDYTVVSDDINFGLSRNYADIYPLIQFEPQDSVYIYSASVMLFNGIITQIYYDVEKLIWNIDASDKIKDLKNYKLAYTDKLGPSSLYTNISASAEDIYVYNYSSFSRQFVKIDDVISAIFAEIGFTLDWTYRGNETIYNVKYKSGSYHDPYQTNHFSWVSVDDANKDFVIQQDLYLFVKQFFCLNQPYVYKPETVNFNGELRDNRPNLFDVLNQLNIITGYTYIPKDSTTYYVSNIRENPIRNINYDTEYKEYTEVKFAKGAKIDYVVPYYTQHSNPPESGRWTFYRFVPFVPGWENGWYEVDYSEDSLPKQSVEYKTGYFNLADNDDSDIPWMNHLIFFNFPSRGGSDHHLNILMPNLWNGTDSLVFRALVPNMGESYTQEYENLVNTEKKTALENIIKINQSGDGISVSKIKIIEHTFEPGGEYSERLPEESA